MFFVGNMKLRLKTSLFLVTVYFWTEKPFTNTKSVSIVPQEILPIKQIDIIVYF